MAISAPIRLASADFRRTPWKNRGGVTIDIAARYRPDAGESAREGGWTGLVWRFGRTRIEVPAPFSDLAGLDRIITVIGGRGLSLRVADGRVLDVREPLRPVAFAGDWPIVSELESGPVEVLNLMGERASVAIEVAFPGPGSSLTLPAGDAVLYAPGGDVRFVLDGDAFTVPGGDALQVVVTGGATLAHVTGVLAVATARPR